MSDEITVQTAEKIARRIAQATVVMAALSLLTAIAAATWPISLGQPEDESVRAKTLSPTSRPNVIVEDVLARISARRSPLVRPPQVQAAVKDSGVASKLAKKLKLQGIIQMGDVYVAYILAEEQGLKTVKKGDSIMDFTVQDISPGKVTLAMEGVEVSLGQ